MVSEPKLCLFLRITKGLKFLLVMTRAANPLMQEIGLNSWLFGSMQGNLGPVQTYWTGTIIALKLTPSHWSAQYSNDLI